MQFETGKLASKANGSVVITQGDNVGLATVTMSEPREGIDFFPLTVDLEERQYALDKYQVAFFEGKEDLLLMRY